MKLTAGQIVSYRFSDGMVIQAAIAGHELVNRLGQPTTGRRWLVALSGPNSGNAIQGNLDSINIGK